MHHGPGFAELLSIFLTPLVWAAMIGVVVLVVRYFWFLGRPRSRQLPPRESALDILRRRYARGEITREQYVQMMSDLYPPRREGHAPG